MSKKTRGSARTRQRGPGVRPRANRPVTRQPETVQPLNETGAASLGAVVSQQPAVEQPVRQAERAPSRAAYGRHRPKPGSLLAARAETEYVYVAQDLKRISVVGVLLFGGLILLWLAIVVLRVIPLPFY